MGYLIYQILLIVGWSSTRSTDETDGDDLRFSVVIPVRNEGQHIYDLLSDLANQSMNSALFEVIVSDDFSEDNTVEQVHRAQQELAVNIYLLQGKESVDKPGKKHAITRAISQAGNQHIVCTDGDCRVGPNWLVKYQSCYRQTSSKMVLGPVVFQAGSNWFEQLQKVEFSALIGLGASSLRLKMPTTCNGANLSYEKKLFEELHGYEDNENVPSGDDEFLLQKAFNRYPDGITFLKSAEAISYTKPKKTLAEFVNQRIRWSAKWRYHTSRRMKIWGTAMFLFYIAWVILLLMMWSSPYEELFLSTLLTKLILEYVNIYRINSDLREEIPLLITVFLLLIYPFYIIFLVISSFIGRYRWKGRMYL
ncbi:MAG: glycosyltransferase [Bacteroidota bacterium]